MEVEILKDLAIMTQHVDKQCNRLICLEKMPLFKQKSIDTMIEMSVK